MVGENDFVMCCLFVIKGEMGYIVQGKFILFKFGKEFVLVVGKGIYIFLNDFNLLFVS